MPAPAVYILAIVGTVAAGIAFKEFVYEPHIAPKVEQWKHEFIAMRQARRRRREGLVAVPMRSASDEIMSKRSDDDDDKPSFELSPLGPSEVLGWRSQVAQGNTSLRQRHNASTTPLDESNASLPYIPITPTPVVFNIPTPSPTISTRASSPLPSSPVHNVARMTSRSTLRSPSPAQEEDLNTPSTLSFPQVQNPFADSSLTDSTDVFSNPFGSSPSYVPSLSLSHPVDLDYENNVELVSPPSSRPDSPFSNLSAPSTSNSFATAERTFSDFGSDGTESEFDAVSSAASEVSDLSWVSAGARSF